MSARNEVIDNLRGLAMLGVIGIHAGSYVLDSSTPWVSLFVLCEVLSRYAVPAFFFISGYGLFLQHPLERPLGYGRFLARRARSVIVPYLVWSAFYFYIWNLPSLDWLHLDWEKFGAALFFGDASYHLYFLVILWWFYVTLPLWRWLVAFLSRHNLWLGLGVLAALQIKLYLWSDTFWTYPGWLKGHTFLLRLLDERINYLPFFYAFVFVAGALAALHTDKFREVLRRHFGACLVLFAVAAAVMVRSFQMYADQGVKLLQIPENLTQLTWQGLLYTVACLSFFSAFLVKRQGHHFNILGSLSKHSYIIYLVHPFFLDGIANWLPYFGMPYRTVPLVLHYGLVLLCSWLTSIAITRLARKVRMAGLLLMGK